MTQTLAIFYDAYRSLNAKKMFWIVLAISGLVVAGFALVGINEKGLKVLVWQLDTEPFTTELVSAAFFYKWAFLTFGIGIWLGWIATILALVSTAGVFPDLVTSGSIDLLVSKPIGRLRLFLTHYLAGLLFVTLQIAIFCVASFLVIGLRGGVWEPGLFMAVPLIVCFFSYLFCVCVLLGLVTRSAMAALLLTLLFWFGVYGIGAAENALLMFKLAAEQRQTAAVQIEKQPSPRQKPLPPADAPDRGAEAEPAEPKVERPPAEARQTRGPDGESRSLATAHKILYRIKTVLPKTTETVGLLERTLIDLAELPDGAFGQPNRDSAQGKAARQVAETLRERSVAWVVGTSLGFEVLVLALAAFLFCRRDF
ncbi:MAG: ABC transporter permease [Pirellulales bacterium]|nr:ABC transporter permease [Pirellulales bacterium]